MTISKDVYWSVVIIKKLLSIMLVIVVITATFAGCTKPVDASIASPFSVYRIRDELRISIGDLRDNIDKIIDADPNIIVEFEDETPEDEVFEQYIYEDIAFDYDRAGNLLGIDVRSSDWKLENGLKVTDSSEDVKRKYSEEYLHMYKESEDYYFSLNENGELIKFSESAPYILRFDLDKHAVRRIVIKKNVG